MLYISTFQYISGSPKQPVVHGDVHGVASAVAHDNHLLCAEMCYWNEADGKHKLIAVNITSFTDGRYTLGQFDGLFFMRYNNATNLMADCDAPGFEPRCINDNLDNISYSLPRTGKNITETAWLQNGTTSKRVLKWNGRKFSY